ncbi:trimethyllysine dioxygenase, mitochondrial isoform X1 [Cloeon dipterum]|uniref:trimethyllysine dioxygenase, mitochondrial isoform X1 n=1 Tax=Cloeon dipterum TaxID=197152 RepID=UPI0032203E13
MAVTFGKSFLLHSAKTLAKTCLRPASTQVDIKKNYLKLTSASGQLVHADLMWLRDHCRCSECYNHATSQRSLPFLSIQQDISPKTWQIAENDSELHISWPDGHTSKYKIQWLFENLDPETATKNLDKMHNLRKLWEDSKAPEVPDINYFELVEKSCPVSLEKAVLSLLQHGIISVIKVPRTVQATRLVVEKIAPPQQTFFGGMWEFGTKAHNEQANHEDTAYTSDALDPHHDSTYFTESTGLQVFHCLERSKNCQGGATRLVDGMTAADLLAKEDPKSFEILSETTIECEYKEPGQHHVGRQPVIVLDPVTRSLLQIRFNLYDRSPMNTLKSEDVRNYYLALQKLAQIIFSGRYEIQKELSPGNVVVIDNWRVLHGRTAFTGQRHMAGCYVSRTEWLSKARVLGLI